ncbi:MAG: dockerin type I domain-containing protein [Sedimentisphaerales bacterium]
MQVNPQRQLVLILILGILFAVCPAYCSTYFVDPNGSDSSTTGDINHPYKTIPKAVTAVAAGGTIYLRGGTHGFYTDANKISISKSGTAGNLITMQNYQNEKPILDFSHQTRGGTVRGISLSGSYWHFKGFTLCNAGDNGLYCTGGHNIFEQLIAYGNQDSGIDLYTGASYNQVINCDSHHNYDPQGAGGNADGFGAKGQTGCTSCLGVGNSFYGCRSWCNSDDGFDLWWAHNAVLIENCWAWQNGYNIWGFVGTWKGNGEGFKMGKGPGAHKVFNCVAFYNRLGGFTLNRNNTDGGDTEVNGVTVDNCTGMENQDNGSYNNFKVPDHSPLTVAIHTLHNNVSYLGSVSIGTQMVHATYNTWNDGFSVSAADFAGLDANDLSAPRGPNGELPTVKYMHLAPMSALRNAGMDVNLPYYGKAGKAPDLGAYEDLFGDCNGDGVVDFLDLKCLADNWLASSCGTCNNADFSGDNQVNFVDFALMAEYWMQ